MPVCIAQVPLSASHCILLCMFVSLNRWRAIVIDFSLCCLGNAVFSLAFILINCSTGAVMCCVIKTLLLVLSYNLCPRMTLNSARAVIGKRMS